MWRPLDALRSPSVRNALFTVAAEGLAVLGMVFTFRLAALEGSGELDQYVVVRRTVAFVHPLVLIGAAVGLSRFVALAKDEAAKRRFLSGALTWVVPFAGLLWLLAALFPRALAWTIFGSPEGALLMNALGGMTFGLCLHAVAYSYFRGAGKAHWANALQLFTLAVAPCASFLLFDGLVRVMWLTAAAWILAPMVCMVPFLLRTGRSTKERAELLRFGLPRVPGDIAFAALLTVPVYVAARTFGLEAAGQVGFAATVLNMVSAVFNPIALVLLPACTTQLAKGEYKALSARIGQLGLGILVVSALMMVVFELVAGPLLVFYLGPTGAAYEFISRLVFLGAVPFAYFVGLRSVLDAYYHTPRNGINLIVAFLVFLVGATIHFIWPTPPETTALALVVSLCYLGWATYRDVAHVRGELQRLAERADESLALLVVVPTSEGPGRYPLVHRQAEALRQVHGARIAYFHLHRHTSITALLRARRRFKRALRNERVDLVLAHYGSVPGLFTVLSSALPVVVYFHGDDLERIPLHGALRGAMGRFFSQMAAFFASGILCTHERLRELLWWRAAEVKVFPLEEFRGQAQASFHAQGGDQRRSTEEKVLAQEAALSPAQLQAVALFNEDGNGQRAAARVDENAGEADPELFVYLRSMAMHTSSPS
jgi:O-antigen/teichoic acid export membrane protein